jgi:hypothetical protein
MNLSVNEITYTYQFNIDDDLAQVRAAITWDPNTIIDVDGEQTSL